MKNTKSKILMSFVAKILKCIFESEQPARSGSCPHFSCREADPGKNTSSHKLISALRRELFISPTGCIQKEKRRLATVRGGLSNWWQPVDSTSYSSFTTLCCAAGIYNHLFHWIAGHFSFHLVEVKNWDIISPRNQDIILPQTLSFQNELQSQTVENLMWV